MKHLLISKQTGEQTLCDKVTIDGFDYYVCNKKPSVGDKSFLQGQGVEPMILTHFRNCEISHEGKKIIATNNPNLDIPQVVDEAKEINIAFKQIACTGNSQFDRGVFHGFVAGYHKRQETHHFSKEDMIEFAKWLDDNMQQREYYPMSSMNHKELLQLWKEQKPQKIYYTQIAAK